ncbi:hypothetical protein [Virgibacillus ndiopensis]|uniref:hypothetical protein n=1 Tax=Virgibacillus ndiopensis TaxID=2004408 RepID=UPI00159B9544|nr:hypothetical protein [Virgibacillus ndiopensis]
MFKSKQNKRLEQRVTELERKVDVPRRNLQVLLDGKKVGKVVASNIERNKQRKECFQ